MTRASRLQNRLRELGVEVDAQLFKRLAFDELLASQLALALARARLRKQLGRPIKGDGRLRARALAALKFTLTPSQEMALAEARCGDEKGIEFLAPEDTAGRLADGHADDAIDHPTFSRTA